MALKTFHMVQGLSRTPLLFIRRYLTNICSEKISHKTIISRIGNLKIAKSPNPGHDYCATRVYSKCSTRSAILVVLGVHSSGFSEHSPRITQGTWSTILGVLENRVLVVQYSQYCIRSTWSTRSTQGAPLGVLGVLGARTTWRAQLPEWRMYTKVRYKRNSRKRRI